MKSIYFAFPNILLRNASVYVRVLTIRLHSCDVYFFSRQIETSSIQFFPLRRAKVLMGQENGNSSKGMESAGATTQKDGENPAGGA